jgi:quinohemoprotein amine dehydrogenase
MYTRFRRLRRAAFFTSLPVLLSLSSALAQDSGTVSTQDPTKETQPGIPVTDRLTIAKCGGCHQADSSGNLTRISWIRTTPEGWQESIRRMVELNGLQVSSDEAHQIVRYLSAEHGLAPDETQPIRWYLESTQPQTEAIPNPTVRRACATCHEFARPMSWRRSKAEWYLLKNMHIGYFPMSQFVAFSDFTRSNVTPKPKPPVDQALDFLTQNYDLYSSGWSNWHAQMTDPDLTGRWLITATSTGKGKYFGEMSVTRVAPGEFKTQATLTSVTDGSKVELPGKSFLYTGYEWRGSAKTEQYGPIREVMTLSTDQGTLNGRWFWGAYQEFGFTVAAQRDNRELAILGTNVVSLHAGAKGVPVKIYGQHFPADLKAADIALGSGVTVGKITAVTPATISFLADIDAKVTPGKRNIAIRGHVTTDAFSVYDKVEYIKITSETALAHVGGTVGKKGFVQYEAHAFANGLDGLSNTADDIDLGPVQVKWSVEEFISHNNDTDKEFVGFIDSNGLFTPSQDGPNPQRRLSADNIGDIWVVARYTPEASSGSALESKSYLVVSVPDFLRFDESAVGGN